MYSLNPYLTVNGASAAIDFYKKAFGATETARMPAEDGKRLIHAEVDINGGKVMLSDDFPEHAEMCGGAVALPSVDKPSSVSIALHFAAPADIDTAFKKAVDAGCRALQKPEDTFWQARFAMVLDPYGHRWMLNAPLKPAN